ncbi:MAG TPA: cysteine peptidase family C39 domain-containing protein [Tenuifilaceae bacterium]|nr:cysteine peptidase family C39 domain-containing protein [Tenuifilaceae bacterium]HQB77512.1 cysteine peptidase family C39 domain-containing protein [Tenuifilaceae bacterium]
MDCGPTCLRMVAKHYGKHYNVQTLRERSHITPIVQTTQEKENTRTAKVKQALKHKITSFPAKNGGEGCYFCIEKYW